MLGCRSNLSGYISWAATHNSVFVLTFDEDDGSAQNQVATIITGSGVVAGTYSETVNHYNLLRTLEDAYGLAPLGASTTASPILDIWAPPAGNQPPVASFTSSCTQLACLFDASSSTDPDGSIASYAWDFNDGSSGTGITQNHAYTFGGNYQVTVTVTDDKGATGTVSHTVTVSANGVPFVSDSFGRTVSNGLGRADTGGTWSTVGTIGNFSVTPGAAALALPKPGSQDEGYIGPGQTDSDVTTTMILDRAPAGGAAYLSLAGRRVATATSYIAKLLCNPNGTVSIQLQRLVSNVAGLLASKATTGFTCSAATPLRIRMQAIGTNPTALRARVWPVSTSEPTTWQVTAADSTAALQGPGAVGVIAYLSLAATNAPVTVRLTSFVAQPTTPAPNQPPVAEFTPSCTQLTCNFDASGSSDPDGSVASYRWDFGDGSTGTGQTATHAFVSAGSYPVALTVTDNRGATATMSHNVTATAPAVNQPPTARFTVSCDQLTCAFDGSASSDPEDGTPTGYSWDFGDSASGSEEAVTHTYTAAGTYDVTLTVTDTDDATDTITHQVAVTAGPPPNQPPAAAFTASCSLLTCAFDGTGSSDPDGTVHDYSWTFGDGTTGSGPTPSHEYAAAGTDSVMLTVTDDDGATDAVTHLVSPMATDGTAFASDHFGRTVSNGWGTADLGGAWSLVGAASRAAVSSGAATLKLDTASQVENYLASIAEADSDVTVGVSVDKHPVGGPMYVSVQARRTATATSYLARMLLSADGSVTLQITRLVSNSATVMTSMKVAGLSYTAGSVIDIRVEATGTSPTSLRARAWLASSAEPTSWQLSTTDSASALQSAGSVGLMGYLSSAVTNGPVVLNFTSFAAQPPAAP